jgi:hypothetical protein
LEPLRVLLIILLLVLAVPLNYVVPLQGWLTQLGIKAYAGK